MSCTRCWATVQTAEPGLAPWEALALLPAPGGVYACCEGLGGPRSGVVYARQAYYPRRRYRTDVAAEAALEAMLA